VSCPIKNIIRQLSPSTNVPFKITVDATIWSKEAHLIYYFITFFLKTMEDAENESWECYFLASSVTTECDHTAVMDGELTH